jgi:plastocyanin domain-containing protein
MKNTTLLSIIVIAIIGISAFFIFNTTNNKTDGNVTLNNSNSENIQKIVLGMKDYNYSPNTIYVKVGQQVSISLDNSVQGCYRTIIIDKLGLKKTFKSSGDTLDFTPIEKGTYKFSCSMGMGTGTIIVN